MYKLLVKNSRKNKEVGFQKNGKIRKFVEFREKWRTQSA